MNRRIASRMSAISPSLTLAITAKAKAMKAAGEPVVSFGVGEPDFNTPKNIIDAAKAALDKGYTKYTPSSGLLPLRKAICEKFKKDNGLDYEPSQIIVSDGAKHSIFNACFALIEEGDEVIIPAPYWLTYPEVVKVCGGVPVYLECRKEDKFKFTPARLAAAITPKTKMLIFNSPSNPTGAVYTEEEVRAIAKVCEEKEIFVLSDEIYEKLCYDGVKPFSVAACSEKMKELTVTVNGVSKTYAMTGWRLGFVCAPPEVDDAVFKIHQYSILCAPIMAQYAAVEALKDGFSDNFSAVEEMRDSYDRRRRFVLQSLKDTGLPCVEPKGAFYAFPSVAPSGLNGEDFAEKLLKEQKVALVPGSAFGDFGARNVRLSYATGMSALSEAFERISNFMNSIK